MEIRLFTSQRSSTDLLNRLYLPHANTGAAADRITMTSRCGNLKTQTLDFTLRKETSCVQQSLCPLNPVRLLSLFAALLTSLI